VARHGATSCGQHADDDGRDGRDGRGCAGVLIDLAQQFSPFTQELPRRSARILIDSPADGGNLVLSQRQTQRQQPGIDARVAPREQGCENRSSIECESAPDPFDRIVD
jgi:hypothetical protein